MLDEQTARHSARQGKHHGPRFHRGKGEIDETMIQA